jgi:hypothetical protein
LATELGRVQLSVTADSRLLAGIAGAVNHVAEAAGLAESARADLIAAVEDICEQAIQGAAPDQRHIEISLEPRADKVEVVLEFSNAAASKDPRVQGGEEAARLHVDSVSREKSGKQTRVTLTKKIA